MPVIVSDYVCVEQRAKDLRCRIPTAVAVLPDNFDSVEEIAEFEQRFEAATIKTLLRNASIPTDSLLPSDTRLPSITTRSFEWIGPAIFIPAAFLINDPNAINVALNVFSNYLTDFFKGTPGKRIVKLSFVVERTSDRTCRKIAFEGPPDQLSQLGDIIRDLSNE